MTETTNMQTKDYRTHVPGEVKREQISGEVEKVIVKLQSLEIREDNSVLLNGQEMKNITAFNLEWDNEARFWVVDLQRVLL